VRGFTMTRTTVLAFVIGAAPLGAAVWLLVSPGWGVFTALALLFVGGSVYAFVGPPLRSRPGRRDPDELSTSPIFGGRGDFVAQKLLAHPVRSNPDRPRR
jgi:hypothetical protein